MLSKKLCLKKFIRHWWEILGGKEESEYILKRAECSWSEHFFFFFGLLLLFFQLWCLIKTLNLSELHFLPLLFSRSVMSDSLQLHALQYAMLPCPSLSPGICSNSCPLSQWCHLSISSSVSPFSSCPQSFPASEFFSQWVDSLHQVAKVLDL